MSKVSHIVLDELRCSWTWWAPGKVCHPLDIPAELWQPLPNCCCGLSTQDLQHHPHPFRVRQLYRAQGRRHDSQLKSKLPISVREAAFVHPLPNDTSFGTQTQWHARTPLIWFESQLLAQCAHLHWRPAQHTPKTVGTSGTNSSSFVPKTLDNAGISQGNTMRGVEAQLIWASAMASLMHWCSVQVNASGADASLRWLAGKEYRSPMPDHSQPVPAGQGTSQTSTNINVRT